MNINLYFLAITIFQLLPHSGVFLHQRITIFHPNLQLLIVSLPGIYILNLQYQLLVQSLNLSGEYQQSILETPQVHIALAVRRNEFIYFVKLLLKKEAQLLILIA